MRWPVRGRTGGPRSHNAAAPASGDRRVHCCRLASECETFLARERGRDRSSLLVAEVDVRGRRPLGSAVLLHGARARRGGARWVVRTNHSTHEQMACAHAQWALEAADARSYFRSLGCHADPAPSPRRPPPSARPALPLPSLGGCGRELRAPRGRGRRTLGAALNARAPIACSTAVAGAVLPPTRRPLKAAARDAAAMTRAFLPVWVSVSRPAQRWEQGGGDRDRGGHERRGGGREQARAAGGGG